MTISIKPTASETTIQENGSDVFTIDSSGITMASGKDLTLSSTALDASASGIYLGGTASANLLDDYEEGTFTPTMLFGGASVGVVYNQQLGFYTKVGDIVHCTIRMVLTNKGSSTGNATIGGLPFTNKNVSGNYPTGSVRLSAVTFADRPQCYIDINGTALSLEEVTNAGVATTLTNANFANNSNTMFTITYRT